MSSCWCASRNSTASVNVSVAGELSEAGEVDGRTSGASLRAGLKDWMSAVLLNCWVGEERRTEPMEEAGETGGLSRRSEADSGMLPLAEKASKDCRGTGDCWEGLLDMDQSEGTGEAPEVSRAGMASWMDGVGVRRGAEQAWMSL